MDKITALEKSIVNLAVKITDANTPPKDVAEEEYEYEEETQNDGNQEGEEVGYVVTNKKSKSDK